MGEGVGGEATSLQTKAIKSRWFITTARVSRCKTCGT